MNSREFARQARQAKSKAIATPMPIPKAID
jgi:hypothetical protein